jgi:subtilisin family serine protease
MNQEQIRQIAYLKAEKRYNQLKEEFDVVLPPEPLFPVAQSFALANGNYPVEKAAVDAYVKNVVGKYGINQKVAIITIDTGAHSNNLATKKNFVMGGQDHTGENETVDRHGHFSFVDSQICGYYNGTVFGALGHPDLPDDFWFHTGEKGLMRSGSATYGMLNQAVETALNRANEYKKKGYKVFINCSWGGGGSDATMLQLFTEMRNAGHFVFAAAGNSGTSGVGFPAKIKPDDVGEVLFAIGAIDKNDKNGYFSSQGKEVDFVSYGVSNYGCGPGEKDFRTGSGTSFASPFLTGLSALLVATFPEIENMQDLHYVLKSGATDLGTKGRDKIYGWGNVTLNNYGEDDLPGDTPDEPDNPPPPEEPDTPVFPDRLIDIAVPGTYKVKYAEINTQRLHKSGVETISPYSIDLKKPAAKQYDWKELELSEVIVVEGSTKPSDVAISERIEFIKRHWTSRGVAMTPPVDAKLGGEIALFFAKEFANRQGGKVVSIQAKCTDDKGNQCIISGWVRP